jgi:threonine synthase
LSSLPSAVICSGCGWTAADDEPYPFRCTNADSGDDVDHVMVRVLDRSQVAWPSNEDDPDPFVRYRMLFRSYHVARAHGMSDDDYLDLVRRIDKEVEAVDGRGFVVTPFGRSEGLSERFGLGAGGGVWVKDETGNVSGSHKARHLMGLLIYLEVVERVGLAMAGEPDLAIASCGNAALAAAVVAKAGDRSLVVFVPAWGDPKVIARLKELGANVNVVTRQEGTAGDPTYHALKFACRPPRDVAASGTPTSARSARGQSGFRGALPFTCQGNENGLAIEGGMTLGYELASHLAKEGATLDRLFVQVGGGALASAVIQGLREAQELGALDRMPRIHTVQTAGGYPLKRAYDRLATRIVERLGLADADEARRADRIAARFGSDAVQQELRYAATHRSEFMWPWEEEPKSVAHGILDDETYDWLAVVRGLLETGGWPITVSEETLIEANSLARAATGIDVDHTGSSGLAGLLQLKGEGAIGSGERAGVLFTGVRR